MKKLAALSASLAWLASVSGCAPFRSGSSMIPVETDPPGAEVYVLGKKVGITPLEISPDDVFPLTYSPEQQPLYGRVVLKKEGCREQQRPVGTRAYTRGVKLKLDCGTGSETVKPGQPVAPVTAPVEERLRRLKDLREKGLITEEEEKETRRRILKEL